VRAPWLCCWLDGAPALASEDSSRGLGFAAVDCFAGGEIKWARDEECESMEGEGGGVGVGEEGG